MNVGLVMNIAAWEFGRWFRWKGTILSLVLGPLGAVAYVVGRSLLGGGDEELPPVQEHPVPVSVIGAPAIGLENQEVEGANLLVDPTRIPDGVTPTEHARPSLERLRNGNASAVLVLDNPDEATLHYLALHSEGGWRRSVRETVEYHRRRAAMAEANMPVVDIERILQPVKWREVETGQSATDRIMEQPDSPTTTAFIIQVLMLVGVYVGLALQFQVITGEKQLRVTEQVTAAVGPQAWMDGKILGLSLLAMTSTATYAASMVLFVLVSGWMGAGFEIPTVVFEPVPFIAMILISTGGFFLWTTFFAGVAATIDNPNTTSRGGFMALPVVPFGLAFLAFDNTETIWIKILSWFPPTAPPILSTRLVLSEVPLWEIALSLVLLAAMVYLLRRAAGKVFALGVLLYGKEPSWREVSRWIREV